MALDNFRARFGKAMMELFGTAILVLSVQISLGNGSQVAPLVVALVFVAIVYAGFPISGGHFNPAITFSVFLRGKLSFHEMLSYWIFQVGGGFCGALLGAIIVGNSTSPAMGKGYFFLQAFLAELVFTAVICFVVLAVSTNCKVEGNSYYGLAVGLAFYAGLEATTPISSGVLNPATALGLLIVKHFSRLPYVLWIVLAQFIGSIAGAALFYIVASDEFEHWSDGAQDLADEARNLVPRH